MCRVKVLYNSGSYDTPTVGYDDNITPSSTAARTVINFYRVGTRQELPAPPLPISHTGRREKKKKERRNGYTSFPGAGGE